MKLPEAASASAQNKPILCTFISPEFNAVSGAYYMLSEHFW